MGSGTSGRIHAVFGGKVKVIKHDLHFGVFGAVQQHGLPLLANMNEIIKIIVYRTRYAICPPVSTLFVKMPLHVY